MTEATQSKTTIERPDELSDLDDKIDDVEKQVEQVSELSGEIGETCRKAAKLDEDGRDVVADEMPDLRQKVTEVETIENLEEVHNEIAEVVAAPHRQALRRAWEDALEVLDLADDLELPNNTLDEELENKDIDELKSGTETLEHTTTRLETVSAAAQTTVAETVQETPTMTYATPVETFKPVVDTIADRHNLLEEIDGALTETAWEPGTTLENTKSLYDTQGVSDDQEKVTEYIQNIDDVIDKSHDKLPLEAVLKAHLEAALTEPVTPELESLFSTINKAVSTVLGHDDSFSNAVRMATAMTEAQGPGSSPDSVQNQLTVIKSMPDPDRESEPLEALKDDLKELKEAYRSWADGYAATLNDDATAIDALDSVAPWAPTFEPPKMGLPILTEKITTDMVADEPHRAVLTHLAYRQWVTELQSEAPATSEGNGTDTVKTMVQLVRGDRISATKVDRAVYQELQNHLEDGLVLQFSSGGGDD